jgi:hypothetical protein
MTERSEEPLSRLRVRPYTVTRGRTDAEIELGVETMIRVTGDTTDAEVAGAKLASESRAILDLCSEPLSTAEISAHLQLPLQVVKVLVGDLVVAGRVATNTGSVQTDGRPDLALLERVLDGLQSL